MHELCRGRRERGTPLAHGTRRYGARIKRPLPRAWRQCSHAHTLRHVATILLLTAGYYAGVSPLGAHGLISSASKPMLGFPFTRRWPADCLMLSMASFTDRRHAGRVLARHLGRYARAPGTCVVALPRSSVPVAYEVARLLGLPLDVFLVRKLVVPGHEGQPVGTIAAGPTVHTKQLIDWDSVRECGITNSSLNRVIATEQRELLRRERLYRGPHRGLALTGSTVLLVDDGSTTASAMRLAIAALREYNPSRLVVAMPLGETQTVLELTHLADEALCVVKPSPGGPLSADYGDAGEVSDDEVAALLSRAASDYRTWGTVQWSHTAAATSDGRAIVV